jgi:putative glutamine amidotransferase
MTNSFHHQAIKDVAPGLRVVARASDGVIEAVEVVENDRFFLGVQWHPEFLLKWDENACKLFSSFIQAAGRRHN